MLGTAPWDVVVVVDRVDVLPAFAHGAAVVAAGGSGVDDFHGARVGWLGPVGTDADAGSREGIRDDAHGAAVPPVAGIAPLPAANTPGSAMGSRNGGCGRDVGPFDLGWLAVCTLAWICWAVGSRSQANNEPNGKCCTTGNLESTSAWYIFSIPYRCTAACQENNLT